MTLTAKRYTVAALSFLFLLSLLLVAWHESRLARQEEEPGPVVTASNEGCVSCHRQDSPALVMEWEASRHAEFGVGCFDCHTASPDDVDAWEHEGVWISALVTPKDCATCHAREFEQFSVSHHARAGRDPGQPRQHPGRAGGRTAGQQRRRRQRLLAVPRQHRALRARRVRRHPARRPRGQDR